MQITRYASLSEPQFLGCVSAFADTLTGELNSAAMYLRKLEGEEAGRRLVVLIAELEPMHPWEWILHNQRGLVLDRAIRRDTANVVICRIRFRATTWTVKPVS